MSNFFIAEFIYGNGMNKRYTKPLDNDYSGKPVQITG